MQSQAYQKTEPDQWRIFWKLDPDPHKREKLDLDAL
jgi:hypothetical protein